MNSRQKAFAEQRRMLNGAKKRLSRSAKAVAPVGAGAYDAGRMLQLDQIHNGDSIQLLNEGAEGWIDLVFADPPFNIGYLYHGYNDRRNAEDYLDFSEQWMKAVHRALKPSGSFYLAIGDEYAADLCVIARRKLGFVLRNWIIWHYTFGQQTTQKFAKSHTHILYFTKGEEGFTFNADSVRVASARQTTYKDSRANPKGKVPDDTWYLRPVETNGEFFQQESDTWCVSRVCGTFKEREGWHGCQMPMQVLNRIVLASSNPGDVVLDPFNGSGTTAVSAALLGRRYVGIDQSAEYVAFARQRLEHALSKAPAAANGNGVEHIGEVTSDAARKSRVMPETDAFGRARVPRRRAAAKARETA